jgi:hypothetical protein
MRRILSPGFEQRSAMVIDAKRRCSAPFLRKCPFKFAICQRPVFVDVLYRYRKAPASIRPIDNLVLFREGVHTQIKRAYELSVCLKGRRLYSPIIASAGVPG